MNLNKAMIIGNLTRDPEMRTTPQGTPVASFTVATNQVWNDKDGNKQERAEYHNVVAWRGLAEVIGKYLNRGSKVYIEGRLQTRDWEGQDGVKRYRTEIIADNMIMLDTKGGSGGGSSQNTGNSYQNQAAGAASQDIPTIQADEGPNSYSSGNSKGDDEINIEDIPF